MRLSASYFPVRMYLLLLPLLLINLPAQAGPEEVINRLKTDPRFSGAAWSITAVFAAGGDVIAAHQPQLRLAPASNLKVVTSAAALIKLGSGFRFATRFYADGSISGNTLKGNIVIVGGGDPALGSRFTKNTLTLDSLFSQVVAELKKLGINRITGGVIADDAVFTSETVPDYFPAIDIGNYYGSGVSGLSILDNTYTVTFAPGSSAGDTAALLRAVPHPKNFRLINEMKTGEPGTGDNGFIYAFPGSTHAYLRGTVPAGVNEFSIKGSIPDPPQFCADSLLSYIRWRNIPVSGAAHSRREYAAQHATTMRLLLTHHSPPLDEIIRIINKRSNNLFTEHLMAALSLGAPGGASVKKGIDTLIGMLGAQGLPVTGIDLYDGSGLSRVNCVTTGFMASVLAFMSHRPDFGSYYQSFPVAGDSADIGGFRRFGTGTALAMNARIKSGLINGVRGLSGYVTDKKGRLIAFSCIANNQVSPATDIDEAFKQVLLALAELQ